MQNIKVKSLKSHKDIFEKVRTYLDKNNINPVTQCSTVCDKSFFYEISGILIESNPLNKYFIFNMTKNIIIVDLINESVYYSYEFENNLKYVVKNNFLISCNNNEIDFIFNFNSNDFYNLNIKSFKENIKNDYILLQLPKGIKSVTKSPIKLKCIAIGEKRLYNVIEDIEYINGLVVPKGFSTDLASCPEILSNIFPHDGEYTQCAILHDFLYSKYNNYGINRETSDKIFLQLMKESCVDYIKALSMYKSVRLFGESHYDRPKINGDNPYEKIAIIDNTDRHKKYQKKMKELLKDWYVW